MRFRVTHAGSWTAALVALLALAVASPLVAADKAPAKGGDDGVEGARATVRMLDDLYKTTALLVATHYVAEEGDLPPIPAVLAIAKAMKDKHWHELRIIDATGSPLLASNAPRDDFEKQAVEKLNAGGTWHDEVIERDGVRYLRAATPLPLIVQSCTMCHPGYKKMSADKPVGVMTFTLKAQ